MLIRTKLRHLLVCLGQAFLQVRVPLLLLLELQLPAGFIELAHSPVPEQVVVVMSRDYAGLITPTCARRRSARAVRQVLWTAEPLVTDVLRLVRDRLPRRLGGQVELVLVGFDLVGQVLAV